MTVIFLQERKKAFIVSMNGGILSIELGLLTIGNCPPVRVHVKG